MGTPTNMRFFYGDSIKKFYRNATNSIEDPIFTGFTLVIDKNTSPLFYSCYTGTFEESNTLNSGETSSSVKSLKDKKENDYTLAENIEIALNRVNKYEIAAYPDSYEINTVKTKDTLKDKITAGYGLQTRHYIDNVLYGAVDYIYMVDKVVDSMYNDSYGVSNVGEGNERDTYAEAQKFVDDLTEEIKNSDAYQSFLAKYNDNPEAYGVYGYDSATVEKIAFDAFLENEIKEKEKSLGKSSTGPENYGSENYDGYTNKTELQAEHDKNYKEMLRLKMMYDEYFDSESSIGAQYLKASQALGTVGIDKRLQSQYGTLQSNLETIQKNLSGIDFDKVSEYYKKLNQNISTNHRQLVDSKQIINDTALQRESVRVDNNSRIDQIANRMMSENPQIFSNNTTHTQQDAESDNIPSNWQSEWGDPQTALNEYNQPNNWPQMWKEAGLTPDTDVKGELDVDEDRTSYIITLICSLTQSGLNKLNTYKNNKLGEEYKDTIEKINKIETEIQSYFKLLNKFYTSITKFPTNVQNANKQENNYIESYINQNHSGDNSYDLITTNPFQITDVGEYSTYSSKYSGEGSKDIIKLNIIYDLINNTSIGKISNEKAEKAKEEQRRIKRELDDALYGKNKTKDDYDNMSKLPEKGSIPLTQIPKFEFKYDNNGNITECNVKTNKDGSPIMEEGEPIYLQYLRAKEKYEGDAYSQTSNSLENYQQLQSGIKELQAYNAYKGTQRGGSSTTGENNNQSTYGGSTYGGSNKGTGTPNTNVYDPSKLPPIDNNNPTPESLDAYNQAYREQRYDTGDYTVKNEVPQTVYDMIGFVNGMTKLTEEYPYVLQTITGLDEAYKKYFESKDPYMGSGDDKISIDCLEFLDLRVSSMFNKYFNAVYDRQYRRERVPINLRRFNCSIFVHDIRNFKNTLKEFISRANGDPSPIVEFALNYISVVEFKFYDCEIVPGETGSVFEEVSNITSGELSKTKFTFTYGNCVINFLPFEDLRRYYLNNNEVTKIKPKSDDEIARDNKLKDATKLGWGSSNDNVGRDGNFRRWFDKSELGNVNNNDYRDYIRKDSSVAVDDYYKTSIVNSFAAGSVAGMNKQQTELDNALRRIVEGISASTGIPATGVADALNIKNIKPYLTGEGDNMPVTKDLGNVNGRTIISLENSEYIGNVENVGTARQHGNSQAGGTSRSGGTTDRIEGTVSTGTVIKDNNLWDLGNVNSDTKFTSPFNMENDINNEKQFTSSFNMENDFEYKNENVESIGNVNDLGNSKTLWEQADISGYAGYLGNVSGDDDEGDEENIDVTDLGNVNK